MMSMQSRASPCIRKMLLTAVVAAVLPACGGMGDTDAVKKANELAIACETEQALMAVDRAAKSGG